MQRPFLPMLSTFLLLLAPTGTAWAAGVPNLHVDQLCHGIASQQADPNAENYPAVSFQRCMDAERDDRDQLQKEWATFTSAQRTHCIAEATAGGSSSYTELLTCLEMAQAAKEIQQSSSPASGPKSISK